MRGRNALQDELHACNCVESRILHGVLFHLPPESALVDSQGLGRATTMVLVVTKCMANLVVLASSAFCFLPGHPRNLSTARLNMLLL